MGIEHRSDQAAAPAAGVVLKKLYKDDSLTQYDVYAFDALDPQSWPKQSAPVAGDAVIDISPVDGDDAIFGSTVPGFDGGFVFTVGTNQRLNLPAQCKPAPTSRGNIALTWIYLPPAASIRKIFGWLRSGPTTGSWGMYSTAGASAPLQYAIFADGMNTTITLPSVGLYCVALGRTEDGNGGFLSRRRVIRADGTIVTNASAASGATAFAPTATADANMGQDNTFGTSADMRIFRHRMLDVGTVAGVATSAWFDAVVDADFAANRARADWKLT